MCGLVRLTYGQCSKDLKSGIVVLLVDLKQSGVPTTLTGRGIWTLGDSFVGCLGERERLGDNFVGCLGEGERLGDSFVGCLGEGERLGDSFVGCLGEGERLDDSFVGCLGEGERLGDSLGDVRAKEGFFQRWLENSRTELGYYLSVSLTWLLSLGNGIISLPT